MDDINRWWKHHHSMGGTVWYTDYAVQSYQSDWEHLQRKAQRIPVEQWQQFANAAVTDNSMPNRETMDDYCKVRWLRNEYKTNGIVHPVTLLYERWHSKWRVHPGSGRCMAAAALDWPTIPAIYINYAWTKNHAHEQTEITSVEQFCEISGSTNFEIYSIFEQYAEERDSVWKVAKANTLNDGRDWQFVRWSEGNNFINYKTAWRKFGTDKYLQENGNG